MNPFGMLVRMIDNMPSGSAVMVQLMRDEEFLQPLTAPLEGRVVRAASDDGEFFDHGMQIVHSDLYAKETRPVRAKRRKPAPEQKPSRMHTMDIDIGWRSSRRMGR